MDCGSLLLDLDLLVPPPSQINGWKDIIPHMREVEQALVPVHQYTNMLSDGDALSYLSLGMVVFTVYSSDIPPVDDMVVLVNMITKAKLDHCETQICDL